MKFICTNRRDCVLQDRDSRRYCGQPTRECGYKEPAEDRQKALRALLEAAEEMREYLRHFRQAERWKAAIDAARKEIA